MEILGNYGRGYLFCSSHTSHMGCGSAWSRVELVHKKTCEFVLPHEFHSIRMILDTRARNIRLVNLLEHLNELF